MKTIDKSGIYSLGGFTFQMKCLVYYLSTIQVNQTLSFELYDDVTIDEDLLTKDEIDDSVYMDDYSGTAIQVKSTNITIKKFERIVLNWLLALKDNSHITKFKILTESKYNNVDLLDDININSIIEDIQALDFEDRPKSLEAKLRHEYDDDFDILKNHFREIKENFELKEFENIDQDLLEAFKHEFNYSGIAKKSTYYERVKTLLSRIRIEIIESIDKELPYTIDYGHYAHHKEHIIKEINDETDIMNFMDFKEMKDTNFENFIENREYQQLSHCYKDYRKIEKHLLYMLYYSHFRLIHQQKSSIQKLLELESISFDNFEDVKDYLVLKNEDQPLARLIETKGKDNRKCENENLKWGSLIYLTKENNGENLISWRDEDE